MIVISYYGHAAFKVSSDGEDLAVFDPYITGNAYSSTDLAGVGKPRFIAVTHASFDHLGDAFALVRSTQARLICGLDVEIQAMQSGLPKDRIRHLTYGQIHREQGILIRALEAHHVSMTKYGESYLVGQPLSFLMEYRDTRIWYGGDTCLFGDIRLYGELYKPHIVVIAIGGRQGRETADITIEEAAIATQWLRPRYVIPVHFPPEASDAEEFKEAVARLAPDVNVAILRPGETLKFEQ